MTSADIDPFAPDLLERFVSLDSISLPFFPGLYCFRDADGVVLYVGQSSDVHRRVREHRKKKWWPQVSSTSVLLVVDPSTRLCAEAVLQLRVRPRHCSTIKLRLCLDGSLKELQFLRASS